MKELGFQDIFRTEVIEFELVDFANVTLTFEPPDCHLAKSYEAMRTHSLTRETQVLARLGAIATIRLRLMDTPDTFDRVIVGIDRWRAAGWQHARRLPCGPMIRVPHYFWQRYAGPRRYPYVGRLTWDREHAKLTEVFA